MASLRVRFSLVLVCVSLALPTTAFGLGPDKRAVINAGIYGAIAGSAMGLIAVPSTRSGRSILIGTSIGLYLGIVAGLYHVRHRDDPHNPLRPYSNRGSADGGLPPLAEREELLPPPALVRVDVPVLTF